MSDIQNCHAGEAWGLSARVSTDGGEVAIGTGIDPQTTRRIVRINGANAKSQTALADFIACSWLTPQMDRLFIDGAATRRRFLDRMVFTFDPGHAGRITRYENAMRGRAKILSEERYDPSWVGSLETQMAETGIAIAAARLDFIQRLQKTIDAQSHEEELFFPKASIAPRGTIEELLQNTPAIECENLFRYQLEQSRTQDGRQGGAATGPHKTDMQVYFSARNMAAEHCSTGEQKALLIGLILAQSRMMQAERGMPPILLLDEIAAHLDEERRRALFERLAAMNTQVWMTGTDRQSFDSIKNTAQFFEIHNADILSAETVAA